MTYATQTQSGDELNRVYVEDLPVHQWYRFILSFPPHLVREYLERFGASPKHRVLDPFCGTGTTLVECKKQGIHSIGLESNPVVQLAAKVKTTWDVNPTGLLQHARQVALATSEALLVEQGPLFQRSLSHEQERLLIKNSISPKPLHKTLILLEQLEAFRDSRYLEHEKVALAKQLVSAISNLSFGPEVGVSRKRKIDAPVIELWLSQIETMVHDLHLVAHRRAVPTHALLADARQVNAGIPDRSIDFVITSPPYPNEKDYSRTTRLEAVLLGFLKDRNDLRRQKEYLVCSNTRNVYKSDTDDQWTADVQRVQELADAIEKRRIELKKTSGFERQYHRVVRLYFGGMARHLEQMKRVLKPGARLAYVVGDQASYLRVLVQTGEILAEIAERSGYVVDGLDLFRTRFSTATQQHLREEVLLLRWPGKQA